MDGTAVSNAAAVFATLKPWDARKDPNLRQEGVNDGADARDEAEGARVVRSTAGSATIRARIDRALAELANG